MEYIFFSCFFVSNKRHNMEILWKSKNAIFKKKRYISYAQSKVHWTYVWLVCLCPINVKTVIPIILYIIPIILYIIPIDYFFIISFLHLTPSGKGLWPVIIKVLFPQTIIEFWYLWNPINANKKPAKGI